MYDRPALKKNYMYIYASINPNICCIVILKNWIYFILKVIYATFVSKILAKSSRSLYSEMRCKHNTNS